MISKLKSTRIIFLLIFVTMLCTSCHTSTKTRKSKDCDCPRWSKAEIEFYQHEEGKV